MAEIGLSLDSLIVESFETDPTPPPLEGDPDFLAWTDASARPCSRCCPEP